jgi:UTP-glucose-1-phosphate uridylyltransferase
LAVTRPVKEMLSLLDKPIVQYGVEEALAYGCDQITIITGPRQVIEGTERNSSGDFRQKN